MLPLFDEVLHELEMTSLSNNWCALLEMAKMWKRMNNQEQHQSSYTHHASSAKHYCEQMSEASLKD